MAVNKKQTLVIIGAGGHAKVVLDAAQESGAFSDYLFVDPRGGDTFCGYPLHKDLAAVSNGSTFVVAIGDNAIRQRNFNEATAHGLKPALVIHPRSIVAKSATVGQGTVVFAATVVNPYAIIGENCILNTGAIVEHDCVIGSHVHIAPGSQIAGGVHIGEGSLVGVGATIIPTIKVGNWCKIAAGAVVIEQVDERSTVFGVPARVKALA